MNKFKKHIYFKMIFMSNKQTKLASFFCFV